VYSARTGREAVAPILNSLDRFPTTKKRAPKEMTTRNHVETGMCDVTLPRRPAGRTRCHDAQLDDGHVLQPHRVAERDDEIDAEDQQQTLGARQSQRNAKAMANITSALTRAARDDSCPEAMAAKALGGMEAVRRCVAQVVDQIDTRPP